MDVYGADLIVELLLPPCTSLDSSNNWDHHARLVATNGERGGILSAYPTELKRIRMELLEGILQEKIAKCTSLTTYRPAEEGFPVMYSSAQEIKATISSFLAECNLPQITLDQLELKLA